MFTGIIEEIGTIAGITDEAGSRRIRISASFASELRVDQSVSVNGVCQTVVDCDEDTFSVVAIEETLRKTNFGDLKLDTPVNLERAMKPGGRLDGHMVQGHVDATGVVVQTEKEQTNWLISVQFDAEFLPYVIPVGSITLDGISLTVAQLEENILTVAIIPHTYTHTTVSKWSSGQRINMEFDMIGKYVVRWMELRSANAGPVQ